MDMDLNTRSAKWKREQDKLKERARRQQQTEALKRAAAEKARLEMEAAQAEKRLERLREQERLEQAALEEQRLTGGIKYLQLLAPVPIASDGDKISLPVAALEELNPQNAFDLGVFTFELSTTDTNGHVVRTTHAGVLEFVADSGTVGLPPKVVASLFTDGVIARQIQVKYVRLEKGRFANLQPKGEGFGDRQIDFKLILERSLKAHTTLTVGDTLFVRHGRQTFEVAVVELQPERAVNILNTDLEVSLLPSEAITQAKEHEQRLAEAAERVQREADEQQKRAEEFKQQKLVALEPEPPMEERMQAKIVLRLPDGSQATRRVAHTSSLRLVFDFVEASVGDEASRFHLIATYPRRVFGTDAMDKSLKELGLNGRQESLFVERIAAAEATSPPESTTVGESSQDEPMTSPPMALPSTWEDAKHVLEQSLDEVLHTTNATPIHALEPMMPVAEASDQFIKWRAQLEELATMGFTNRELNVQILERYQGRLLRVVNYLSELASHESDNPLVEPIQQ